MADGTRANYIFSPAVHVRALQGDPRALLPAMRAAVRELDPEMALLAPQTLAKHVDNNLFLQRVPARLLSVLGALALALSAIGLYGVLAYSLAQRTREIAVRLTLGATPHSVVWFMIWQHMRIVLIAAVLGWLVSLGLNKMIGSALVDVPLGDPMIYAGVPLLLVAVAILACWLPARRAAGVDPMTALRAE